MHPQLQARLQQGARQGEAGKLSALMMPATRSSPGGNPKRVPRIALFYQARIGLLGQKGRLFLSGSSRARRVYRTIEVSLWRERAGTTVRPMSKSILGPAPRVLVTENNFQYRVVSPEFSDRIVSLFREVSPARP
jgi:hypothetical protein